MRVFAILAGTALLAGAAPVVAQTNCASSAPGSDCTGPSAAPPLTNAFETIPGLDSTSAAKSRAGESTQPPDRGANGRAPVGPTITVPASKTPSYSGPVFASTPSINPQMEAPAGGFAPPPAIPTPRP